ncbi:MAG: helix-turn-helix transcriptional regulator [Pleomorphochaeta sp.]
MRSQKDIDLLCKITNAYYLKFLVNGECISKYNPTNVYNLDNHLYYSKKLLFENLSTDIVLALKEDLFYILVKETTLIHVLGPLEIDFKDFDDSTFVSYEELLAVSKLFYYLITGYNLYSHIPRFVDESYKYYKGEKYFFSEEKIFDLEEQPNYTFNNQYQLYNIFSISLKEKNKTLLRNYINSLLQEDLFDELLKDYMSLGVENLDKLRLQKNILIHSLSQMMYYLHEYIVNNPISNDESIKMISKIEKANDINSLISIAYKLIDEIMELIDDNNISNNQYIRFATNYIILNLDQKLTLDIISSKMSISSKYLSKLFKKELNISFKDYLIDKRIEKAKKLLQYTDKSLSDISLEIGINNSNNFIAFFKNYTNFTPMNYRDINKQ